MGKEGIGEEKVGWRKKGRKGEDRIKEIAIAANIYTNKESVSCKKPTLYFAQDAKHTTQTNLLFDIKCYFFIYVI